MEQNRTAHMSEVRGFYAQSFEQMAVIPGVDR